MRNLELKAKIIKDVCEKAELDEAIVMRLLDLENRHRDLLAWGARPGLRRDIATIMDEELEKRRTATE